MAETEGHEVQFANLNAGSLDAAFISVLHADWIVMQRDNADLRALAAQLVEALEVVASGVLPASVYDTEPQFAEGWDGVQGEVSAALAAARGLLGEA